MRNYELEAQRAAEAHLDAIFEAESFDEDPTTVESPAIGSWCGCTTCIVREVLHAAWPSLLKAARQG